MDQQYILIHPQLKAYILVPFLTITTTSYLSMWDSILSHSMVTHHITHCVHLFSVFLPQTVTPTISSLTYQEENCTLTCVSTGSPPTVVSWMKDGENITIDGHHFSLSQTITDRLSSTYSNTLTVREGVTGGVTGIYNCRVSNVLGSETATVGEWNLMCSVVLNILGPHWSVAVSSLSQSECSPSNTEPPTNSSSTTTTENGVTTVDTPTGYDFFSTTTAIIGGIVVALVLIIVVAIFIIIVALLVLKNAGKKYAVLTNEAKEFRIFILLLQEWSLYTNLPQ